jgi:hypothetical protein
MEDPVAGRTELLKVIRRIRSKCPSALEIMLTGLSGHGKSSTICDTVTAIQDESITTTAPAIATAYSGSSQVTKFAYRYTICGEGAPLPASSMQDSDESDENVEDGGEEEEDTKDSKDSKTASVVSAAAKLKNKRDVEPSAIRLWDSRGLTLGSPEEKQKEREVQNLMYEGHIKEGAPLSEVLGKKSDFFVAEPTCRDRPHAIIFVVAANEVLKNAGVLNRIKEAREVAAACGYRPVIALTKIDLVDESLADDPTLAYKSPAVQDIIGKLTEGTGFAGRDIFALRLSTRGDERDVAADTLMLLLMRAVCEQAALFQQANFLKKNVPSVGAGGLPVLVAGAAPSPSDSIQPLSALGLDILAQPLSDTSIDGAVAVLAGFKPRTRRGLLEKEMEDDGGVDRWIEKNQPKHIPYAVEARLAALKKAGVTLASNAEETDPFIRTLLCSLSLGLLLRIYDKAAIEASEGGNSTNDPPSANGISVASASAASSGSGSAAAAAPQRNKARASAAGL